VEIKPETVTQGDSGIVFTTTSEFCRNISNLKDAKSKVPLKPVTDSNKRVREEESEPVEEDVVDARHAQKVLSLSHAPQP